MDDVEKLGHSVLANIVGSDPDFECLPPWAYDLNAIPQRLQFPAASVVDAKDMRLAVQVFQKGLGGNMSGTLLVHAIESLMFQYSGHTKRASILIRCIAFYFLVNDSAQIAWARWQERSEDTPETIVLHPAVIDAVAKAPTLHNGEFNSEEFFLVVETIAADDY